MSRATAPTAHTDRPTPPADLSDMPRDPRWAVHGTSAWYDGGRLSVPARPDQLRVCQELDWWHVYHAAARGVRQLERRLAEQARERTAQAKGRRAARETVRRLGQPARPPAAPPVEQVALEPAQPVEAGAISQGVLW